MSDALDVGPLGPVADLGLHPEPVAKDARCDAHANSAAVFRCSLCKQDRCDACRFGALGARAICRSCSAGGLPAPIPWELRNERGVVATFLETAQHICLRPTAFFRTPALEDDAVGAFEFGLVCFGLGQLAVVAQAFFFAIVGSSVLAMQSRMPGMVAAAGGYGCLLLAMVPTMLVHVPVTAILSVGTASVGTHGTLRLLGAARAPFFAGTVRGMSYAFAAHLFVVVPIVGPLIGLVWMLIVEFVALRELHRTTTALALVAVLGYRLLFLSLLVASYGILIGAAVFASHGR